MTHHPEDIQALPLLGSGQREMRTWTRRLHALGKRPVVWAGLQVVPLVVADQGGE